MQLLIPSLYVLMAHFMGTLCVGDIMLNYNPTPPRFPPSFAASFVMKLPYIDLHIQMTVRQVMQSGLQHVSFYDGLEQHFVNMASDEIAHLDDYVVDYLAVNTIGDHDNEKYVDPLRVDAVPRSDTPPPPRRQSVGGNDVFNHFGRNARSSLGASNEFAAFKALHRRSYADDDSAYEKRFRANLAYIDRVNEANNGVRLEVNSFADGLNQPPKGHRARNGPRSHSHPSRWNLLPASEPLPERWDWRDHGASPPIKDQGTCGSCWAFATIGAIESRHKIVNGAGEKLAEQFLLDCTWNEVNGACLGGNSELTGATLLDSFQGFVPLTSEYGKYLSASSYCK
ncbi:cysteine proteinase 3 precursor, putative [Perkinsus marinus ATCC 50983]|uniref:Cysteine proteinase 3, putative n=1 Tax=Perkinsus marinus (strain ATCC 50983 / TXsc) TaxID=423536 RepID=C5LS56_PERM5|nr:cysteine proteinase 3 precursor, putative [Perkinsus marinus ATCC 50983]EER00418.1 cysteine proteinase 3 precursor, putative [Perkinsus marinus ATCC 50983]|eukprot:XP_002767700.1 cysteine proteinase 3 precursor, putative [Perkinsus marinus ATCC 50983]